MMCNRPAIDQYQPNQDLRIAGLAVAAVAIGSQAGRSLTFEIGRGQIIKDRINLEGGQIAQPKIELMLDPFLAFKQLIERAVPLLQLARLHTHARRLAGFALYLIAPCRDPAASLPVAAKIGFQPPG
jgi:hypothetical protein